MITQEIITNATGQEIKVAHDDSCGGRPGWLIYLENTGTYHWRNREWLEEHGFDAPLTAREKEKIEEDRQLAWGATYIATIPFKGQSSTVDITPKGMFLEDEWSALSSCERRGWLEEQATEAVLLSVDYSWSMSEKDITTTKP